MEQDINDVETIELGKASIETRGPGRQGLDSLGLPEISVGIADD